MSHPKSTVHILRTLAFIFSLKAEARANGCSSCQVKTWISSTLPRYLSYDSPSLLFRAVSRSASFQASDFGLKRRVSSLSFVKSPSCTSGARSVCSCRRNMSSSSFTSFQTLRFSELKLAKRFHLLATDWPCSNADMINGKAPKTTPTTSRPLIAWPQL
jgi:hypothetical protein